MLYRFISDKDAEDGDELFVGGEWIKFEHYAWRVNEKLLIRRPVPELRPVQDLTRDEWAEITRQQTTLKMFLKADEIRSRPRETEKEKWIRAHTPTSAGDCWLKEHTALLSDTWDAAYEAGRGSK